MTIWFLPVFVLLILLLLILLIIAVPSSKKSNNKSTSLSYKRRALLTPNELNFYNILLPIADSKQLAVFTKVRIADLLDPAEGTNWQTAFNKIKSKHVDFVLCDKQYIRPLMVIELDDNSHQRKNRNDRDIFVDKAYESAGLPILHTLGSTGLSEKIDAVIKKKTTKAGA